MSLLVDTTYRTDADELLDDFNIGGPLLHDTLDKLATINRCLGGNRVTLNGLQYLLKNHPKEQTLTLVDLGCGGGDILRDVSRFGKKHGYQFNLIGIDANPEAVAYASKLSDGVENLQFKTMDVFSKEFNNLDYDVVLCTLFLHHFKQEQLKTFLKKITDKATVGIVVNDLHRHRMAYYLFKTLCLTIKNEMIVQDGLTSVLRGFKRKDIEHVSNQLNLDYRLKWKWAFRWQWVMKKEASSAEEEGEIST